MTSPGWGQHSTFGRGQPPFDAAADQTIAAMRARMDAPRPPLPRPLTEEEKREAEQAAQEQRSCLYCGGLHVAPSTPACPRLSGGKLDGDGKIVEFTFWPGRDWAEGRVVFMEDALEEGSENVPEPEGGPCKGGRHCDC